jgi:hypothetical protein
MKRLIFGKYSWIAWLLLLIWASVLFAWVFQDLSQINSEVNITLAAFVSIFAILVGFLKD